VTRKNRAVAVFLRNPVLGKVKTRLANQVGEQQALIIYHQLLDIAFATLQKIEEDVILFLTDHTEDFIDQPYEKLLQSDGDLGAKMLSAFENLTKGYVSVVLIGSDCPYLTPSLIKEAFEKLDKSDLVLGPSLDGGYYLIGMNTPHPTIFDNIEWSTETVFTQTIERITKADLTYALLETLGDIDYYEDWEAYLESK
jgi:uncharacterized protein